jgi:integrase
LFRSPKGGVVSSSTYYRVRDDARQYMLTPAQVASPLAGRPYDLRHAAVSLWLNGGVPATEVAERAGHSVDVLLKVYAKCVDGQKTRANEVIERLITEGGPASGPRACCLLPGRLTYRTSLLWRDYSEVGT